MLPCGDAAVWFVGDACHGCACLNGDEKSWCWTQCYYLRILQQGDEHFLTCQHNSTTQQSNAVHTCKDHCTFTFWYCRYILILQSSMVLACFMTTMTWGYQHNFTTGLPSGQELNKKQNQKKKDPKLPEITTL